MYELISTEVHVRCMCTQVCPPGLHLTLGIFYRLFKLLEDQCHELDIVAKVGSRQAGASYEAHIASLRQQSILKEETERVERQVAGMEQLITTLAIALPNANSHTPYQQFCQQLCEKKDKLKKMVSISVQCEVTTTTGQKLPQNCTHWYIIRHSYMYMLRE